MQVSSVSAMHLPETPTPGWPGLAAAILLPIVEADSISPNAAWLTELARHVLMLVERMVPVKMLPVLTAGCFPTMRLTIWPTQPLLIIPWGITSTQNPRTTGGTLALAEAGREAGGLSFCSFSASPSDFDGPCITKCLGGLGGRKSRRIGSVGGCLPWLGRGNHTQRTCLCAA